MNRRAFIAMTVAAAVTAAPALAQDLQKRIIAQLKAQGVTEIRVSRTLLGRTRILARGPGYKREIIFNPRTGEILRDYWRPEEDSEEALLDPRADDSTDTASTDDSKDDSSDDSSDDSRDDSPDDQKDDEDEKDKDEKDDNEDDQGEDERD